MDTDWLRRLGHSPEPHHPFLFGAYLAGSAAACKWYRNTLEALPSRTRLQERLRLAVLAIDDRAHPRNWRFQEGREAYWLGLLCNSLSDAVRVIEGPEGVRVMVGAYLSHSRKRRQRFRKLCEAHPHPSGTMQEVLSVLALLDEQLPDQYIASEPKFALARLSLAKTALLVACVLGVFAGFVGWREYVSAQGWQPYSTSLGQYRRMELPDGSVVELNTATSLKYQATASHRIVELGAGEARFRLAHDAKRRFVVMAGTWAIYDVGTDYSVRLLEDGQVDVAVFEGEVRMTRRVRQGAVQRTIKGPALGGYETSGLALHANQMLVPGEGDNGQELRTMSPEEIKRRNAWRAGKLIFADTPLAQAVAELNRYNSRQLVIVDPGIAGVRVNGAFNTNGVIEVLPPLRFLGVRYRTIGSGDNVRFELFGEKPERDTRPTK